MKELIIVATVLVISETFRSIELNIGIFLLITILSILEKSPRAPLLLVSILILKQATQVISLRSLYTSLHLTLHSSFSQFINQYFPNEYANFLISITIGTSDTKLSKGIYELFKRFNLLHVVSISGANFALIKELIEKANAYINKKTLYFFIMLVQTYYILLIGVNNLPALRAFIFSVITGYSITVGRPISFTNKLLLTILVITAINVNSLGSLSLILSIGFSILYRIFDLNPFKRIFNNELKKLTLVFIISMFIFNSSKPDFIANAIFAIIYPLVFVGTFTTYILFVLNLEVSALANVIYLLAKTIIYLLGELSSNINTYLQLLLFLAILIIITRESIQKRSYEFNQPHQ